MSCALAIGDSKLHVAVHPCQVWSVLVTDPRVRAAYAEGAGVYRIVPAAVAIPQTVADVVSLVRQATASKTPLIPRGAGSGMPGSNVGSGIIADLSIGFAELGIDLLIGAEGTLGIVTAVHWKLDPIPPDIAGAALGFAGLEAMADAVPYLVSLNPSAIELLDETLLRFVPEAPKVACLLLVEFEREHAAAARGAAGDAVHGLKHSAVHVETAVDRAGLERLWSVRRLASPALARLPASQRSLQLIEDGCVPLEALGAYVAGLREAARRRDIPVAIFGHAGDGHVHVNALPDTTRDGWREALAELFADVTDLLVRLGGVPSGEHGVGRLRAGVLERFYGKEVMELFRDVKRAYDPLSILNPGVIIPATDWSPVAALKVGAGAAAIPDDIATRLREVERSAAWATPKLELAH